MENHIYFKLLSYTDALFLKALIHMTPSKYFMTELVIVQRITDLKCQFPLLICLTILEIWYFNIDLADWLISIADYGKTEKTDLEKLMLNIG